MPCIKGTGLKGMSVSLQRDWHCICFSNAPFPALVKAVMGGTAIPTGGHRGTLGQVSSSDLTFPLC